MRFYRAVWIGLPMLLVGLTLGWFGHGLLVHDQRPVPESAEKIRAELLTLIELTNRFIQENNPGLLNRPPEISVSPTHHFYLDQGVLGEMGLKNFTGRIVAWNGSEGMTKPNWPDRPNNGPDLSLIFEEGKLICVDRATRLRYFFEDGRVKQIVSYAWGFRAGNAYNNPQGTLGEHPYDAWRFDAAGRLTHRVRIAHSQENTGEPAWDPQGQNWISYRSDFYYAGGKPVLKVQTGPNGKLRTLGYLLDDKWHYTVYNPTGAAAFQTINEAPEK